MFTCDLDSILGAVVVIIGLYLLLWGKEDQEVHREGQGQSQLACDEQKELTIQMVTSTERKVSPGQP